MELNVVNARTLGDLLVKSGQKTHVGIYRGTAQDNLEARSDMEFGKGIDLTVKNAKYAGTQQEADVLGQIASAQRRIKEVVNSAQPPSASDIAALFGAYFMDITRRYQEKGDMTGQICREVTDPNFPRSVTLTEFYKFIGKFGVIAGTGDKPNLIQELTGETATATLKIGAIGHKNSLADVLYNKAFDLAKVNDAVAEAYADYQNSLVIGAIVAATFHWSQKVSFTVNTNQTYEENLYNAFRWGVKKLRKLLDNVTNRPISTAPGIRVLCNSQDSWDIMRVINGALAPGGQARGFNRSALPIDTLLEYDHGATDGFAYGVSGNVLSFPGVAAGEAYLFVPGYGYKLRKRGLTLETGMGSVLEFSQTERAWYDVGGEFLRDLLGSSYASPPSGHESGYGAIVKVELPTDET